MVRAIDLDQGCDGDDGQAWSESERDLISAPERAMAYNDLSVVLETHTRSLELFLVSSLPAERLDAHLVGLYMPCGGRKRGWLWS
jgi:hypothetical protein